MPKWPPNNPLIVRYVGMNRPHRPRAWRVTDPTIEGAVPIAFARRVDAEMALRGLNAAGIHTTADLVRIAPKERERIMLEALAW